MVVTAYCDRTCAVLMSTDIQAALRVEAILAVVLCTFVYKTRRPYTDIKSTSWGREQFLHLLPLFAAIKVKLGSFISNL